MGLTRQANPGGKPILSKKLHLEWIEIRGSGHWRKDPARSIPPSVTSKKKFLYKNILYKNILLATFEK